MVAPSAKGQVAPVDSTGLYAKQAETCKEKGWPHFAPSRCYCCNKDVYSHPGTAAEVNAGGLVTGCRWCYRSFCE